MSKFSQRLLMATGVALVVAVAAALLARHLLGTNVQARLEASASQASGMEVRIAGAIGLHFLPRLHVTLKDVRVATHGTTVAVVEKLNASIELASLLHRDLQIKALRFENASVSIERDLNGHLNIDQTRARDSSQTDASIASVTFVRSKLTYTDRQSQRTFTADNCDMQLQDLRFGKTGADAALSGLSFSGNLACDHFQSANLDASNVKAELVSNAGALKLDPISFRLFSGDGRATIATDLSAREPVYRIHMSVAKFALQDFSNTALHEKLGTGSLDFTTDLTMHSTANSGVLRTASGAAELRGVGLVLEVGDLDQQLSRYEATQNFNLVDVGAFLLAGPVGLAVTKGYDYSRVLKKSAGTTAVPVLLSRWKVADAMATAQDVALVTAKNRLALTGGLDFVNDRYVDVTVALVGADGCARVQQNVRGSFRAPEVQKPNVVTAISAPARKLIDKGRGLLGKKCSVFYAGAVAAPQ